MNFDSMARIPKRWKYMVGLIAALAAVPAYPQHEGGNVYMGVAGGYHMAPEMQDSLQETLDDVFGRGVLIAYQAHLAQK